MMTLRRILLVLSTVFVFCLLFSCQDDDNDTYRSYDYIITVVPDNANSFYLVTDSGETLEPAKNYGFKPHKEQRAIAVLSKNEKKSVLYDHIVNIHRLDTFLTKGIVENPEADDSSFYGNDPIDIHDYWIGDGYLNIWFGTYWGSKTHFVNLIRTDERNNPYALEFRHNAYNDSKQQYLYSIVAFDLSSLPETDGKTVKLTVKVNEDGKEKTLTLDYNSDVKRGKRPEDLKALFQQNLRFNTIK